MKHVWSEKAIEAVGHAPLCETHRVVESVDCEATCWACIRLGLDAAFTVDFPAGVPPMNGEPSPEWLEREAEKYETWAPTVDFIGPLHTAGQATAYAGIAKYYRKLAAEIRSRAASPSLVPAPRSSRESPEIRDTLLDAQQAAVKVLESNRYFDALETAVTKHFAAIDAWAAPVPSVSPEDRERVREVVDYYREMQTGELASVKAGYEAYATALERLLASTEGTPEGEKR